MTSRFLGTWIVSVLILSAPGATLDGQGSNTGAATRPPASRRADLPRVAITDFTLPNGLRVVLHEDHSSPIVAMELFAHVGSKNDTRGKTGLAHLFEHLADAGSTTITSEEFQRTVDASGGFYNATTGQDWTRYYTLIPSNQLETMLWLQADRLAGQRPSAERFRSELGAVDNEYRQFLASTANRVAEVMIAQVFAGTPYEIPVHGFEAERKAATVDDIVAFGKQYQIPNNTVLVIAGDFNTADARRFVTKYFGPIARGDAVTQPAVPPPLTAEKRFVLENPTGTSKQLWIGWRGVQAKSTDRLPLQALSSILTSRLTRLLVSDRRLASSMQLPGAPVPTNAAFDLELGGIFQTTVAVTGSMTEAERLIDSVVAAIQSDGVTKTELDRWTARFRTTLLGNMLGVQSKAYMLGDATITQGKPSAQFDDVDVAFRLRPSDIQRVANRYLVPERVVISVVPAGKLSEIAKPDQPYVSIPWKR